MQSEGHAQPIPILDYAPPPPHSALAQRVWTTIGYLIALLSGAWLAALITYHLLPIHYGAETLLYLAPATKPGTMGMAGRSQFLASEAQKMTSAPVLTAASQMLVGGPMSKKQWGEAVITTELDYRSDLISITVRHPNPAAASTISNAVLDAYKALALQSPASVRSIEVLQFPPPPAQLLPRRNVRWVQASTIFGALAGMVALMLYRQRRSA